MNQPAAAADPAAVIAEAERLGVAGRHAEAAETYRRWLAANAASPLAPVLQFNLGVTLSALGDHAGAEQAYRAAILGKPDFVQAWFNLGTVMERQGRAQNALLAWQSMIDRPLVGPAQERELYLMVVNAMGRLLEEQRRFHEAEERLRQSLDCEPQQPKVIQHWVHLRQKQCEWPVYEPVAGLGTGELLRATSPLAMLSASDDPGLQLAAAVHFARERVDTRAPLLAPERGYGHARLRIGFLSSDFCLHAVSLLTVELFELLDRSRFELHGFCWSREDGSAMRARVIAAMDRFHRIHALGDAQAAELIRAQEIDVLVDLQGLTSGARPDIVARRPAPVQITYLGFPGPTGLPCIDYVIADRFLIPDAERPYYTEQPLYLADVFQSCDRQRPVAPLPTRAEVGLPEQGFVYCSFNNNYKFTPEVFDSWMRILSRVPGSWLWLLADNEWAEANLRTRARAAGLEDRLVFAPRVAPPQYLARYTCADLFLDAYPFNGGTTANDALFMELPVLTRSGRTFASRMAGSLLTALELPELITTTLEDYEERAVRIGLDPAFHAAIRERLAHGRRASPLFAMPRFVAEFARAIESVAKR
jgi:predicted O-linked N-acetylglucosamine transferase (SPINDLY family)